MQKFVYITGALDFLVGAGAWAGAFANFQAEQFASLMTLGTFLMMAAACLMWASKDMVNRSPVIFWQGLVRLTAVASTLYAPAPTMPVAAVWALVIFDGVIGLTYVIGMVRVTGLSPIELLQCKTA